MAAVGDIWFRLEDVVYAASVDEYGYPYGSGTVAVRLWKMPVEKVTPKGVRLYGRFVRNEGRKRWAHPTVEEAITSFRARKGRQIDYARAVVTRAEQALSLVEKGVFE